MRARELRADGLLLLTALIWGVAFVAQRVGMDHVGPMTFNGVRFALGALVLAPFALRRPTSGNPSGMSTKAALLGGLLAGLALFAGASFQQVGIMYTTAGNAGFITGLYVVFVPILGLLWKQRPTLGVWIGALLAAMGLYLLSITDGFTMSAGDLLVLVCAFCFAGHVLVIGWLAPKIPVLRLSVLQYACCAAFSFIAAAFTEEIRLADIAEAAIPILYGGLMSVGVAYTLQVVAQKDAPPAHASILLSLEGAFAALAGGLLLGETMTTRGITGCGLMLAGMLLAQLWPEQARKPAEAPAGV
ncbi:putative permease, DMT superfamily [Desulfocurvibacter africanus PCS]|uniref:Putative permease, DMT superfamily n=1 Tax=Desulfocurvibacter africanus PCS TaxID=1262666 RepID=M5Q0V2_DESAF|nr:DMT family transporter [Desulfocurvibacter africanus]EMG37026.1 putative permease, DMT superfamily [Desulfocurvibacter africanus PCS]